MEHPEVKPIFRQEVVEAVKQPRVTREFYTKSECTALLQHVLSSSQRVQSLGHSRRSEDFGSYVRLRNVREA
jgi:hypothetical protein